MLPQMRASKPPFTQILKNHTSEDPKQLRVEWRVHRLQSYWLYLQEKARDFKGIKFTGMTKTPGYSLEYICSPMLTDGGFEGNQYSDHGLDVGPTSTLEGEHP